MAGVTHVAKGFAGPSPGRAPVVLGGPFSAGHWNTAPRESTLFLPKRGWRRCRAMPGGLPQQPPPHLLMEPGGSGKGDGLFLHLRVHLHFTQISALDQFLPSGLMDGLFEQLLQPLRPHPFAPFHQEGRMEGKAVPEIGETPKILPTGILRNPLHHRLVALVEGALEIMPAHFQTDRPSRTGLSGMDHCTETELDHLSVDLMGNLVKAPFPTQNLIGVRLKPFQPVLGIFRGRIAPAFGLISHDPGGFTPCIFK